MTAQPSRERIERAIETLIAVLDAMDADPDLEPSFGFVPAGLLDECEPDADLEASLGWTTEGRLGSLNLLDMDCELS